MGERAPAAEYSLRLEAARRETARLDARAGRVSNLRLAVFLVGAVVAFGVFGPGSMVPAWLAPPVLGFALLVVVHDRMLQARDRSARIARFYERGLARLSGAWPGSGASGEGFADAEHPYAEDLDLFGRGSLFELLSTARTHAGERTLADWLLAPAEPDEIRARQAAVAELRAGLDLREDLAATGADVRGGLHPEALERWGEAPPALASPGLRAVSALLPALSVAALAAWLFGWTAPLPFALALGVQSAFAWGLRARVRRAIAGIDLPGRELLLLSELLERVEAESLRAPLLVALQGALETGGLPPSRQIRALRTRIDLLDARRNQLFAPVAALLLWTTQLAFAIERWRQLCGSALGRWIAALGELEALLSLAGYAWEHPEQPFPEIAEGEGPIFHGEQLGHPLLPPDRCVANDVSLGGDVRVWIVSGSNMSGKSTLLRTVGSNAVLAQAGAPVRARRLRLSPLAIGASIRTHDSLLGGTSRFYAEIQRLRQIVEVAEHRPGALFLLDEILHGTNSHDRGIGAEAVVRGLLARGAVGLVTTHDLALARMVESLAPRAANVHFEDRIEEGRIVFDYRLRSGVVERSNALELMRAVGLEV
jgi:hypothetical protein